MQYEAFQTRIRNIGIFRHVQTFIWVKSSWNIRIMESIWNLNTYSEISNPLRFLIRISLKKNSTPWTSFSYPKGVTPVRQLPDYYTIYWVCLKPAWIYENVLSSYYFNTHRHEKELNPLDSSFLRYYTHGRLGLTFSIL